MSRYHPLLVALHWLLAIMIMMALFFGMFALSDMPNDDPEKVMALRGHMTMGIIILVLMVVRLVTRLVSAKPPEADIGVAALNTLSRYMHWVLYLGIFVMLGSGIAMSMMAGLPAIMFGGSGDPLPASFFDYPPRIVHGIVGSLLALLIVGHIAAAVYHQVVRRDALLSRMWFGKRQG